MENSSGSVSIHYVRATSRLLRYIIRHYYCNQHIICICLYKLIFTIYPAVSTIRTDGCSVLGTHNKLTLALVTNRNSKDYNTENLVPRSF